MQEEHAIQAVRITRNPNGPQLHVAGVRVHHFAAGLCAIALGLIACAHDRKDLMDWLLHG